MGIVRYYKYSQVLTHLAHTLKLKKLNSSRFTREEFSQILKFTSLPATSSQRLETLHLGVFYLNVIQSERLSLILHASLIAFPCPPVCLPGYAPCCL
jgi:hypothetical protein